MDFDFYYNVYAIVEEIPKGNVASYKQIAELAGRPNNSRLVGKALACAELFGSYPCYRVVHHDGGLVKEWSEQMQLLENEGITFLGNQRVNMSKHQWHP